MKKLLVVATAFLLLAGCGGRRVWNKPGSTRQEFSQDKYECMQQSQNRVSRAYVDPYGGSASSRTATNVPLFNACMEARGYSLERERQ
jgi:hypothetical protein